MAAQPGESISCPKIVEIKYVVRRVPFDPLPPAAALPLERGRITVVDFTGVSVPFREGDGRCRRPGVTHTPSVNRRLKFIHTF
jgi:hypothetical protein